MDRERKCLTMATEEFIIKAQDGVDIFCKKDIPDNPRAVIVIVHGFAEHLARYGNFVQKLNDAQIACFRFDNRGHGRSGGIMLHVESYNEYINDADLIVQKAKSEFLELPLFMFGHSMGGFIAAIYGEKHKDRLAGQILSGAVTDEPPQSNPVLKAVIKILNAICPKLRIKNDLSFLVSRDTEVVNKYRNDPLIHNKATVSFFNQFIIEGIIYLKSNIKEYKHSCLILHGKEDKLAKCKSSENFYNNISSKDKSIKIYDNLYHEILNEPEKDIVINDILIWLNSRIDN
jgi:alpha-beta hydrolase superfamily lysophospholipase